MDIRQIVMLCFFALSKVRLPRGNPPPEPNVMDIYKQCRSQVDADNRTSQKSPLAPSVTILPAFEPPPTSILNSQTQTTVSTAAGVATACVPCLRGHISAVSGALTEALRMSRGEGIATPDVAERIRLAQDEITIAERKDLTPEAILASSPVEREIIDEFLPRVRELRQHITTISNAEDLLEVSAEANALGRDLTLRHLESKGIDTEKLNSIAEEVKSGVMTLDQAKERVKELVR